MQRESSATARHLALIGALVLFISVPSLLTRELWSPDEPRYMEVAREMASSGDYLVPRLNGETYAEKPPLFFWLSALIWRAGFGHDAGRVLAVLSALFTVWACYLGTRGLIGAQAALLGACAAATTLLLLFFCKVGVLDALLTFFVASAVLAGYHAMRPGERHRRVLWLLCYTCLALGVLTKGPVGLLVPGLVLVVYGLLNRRSVRAGGWSHLWGAALMCVLVLAWLAPALAVGGRQYAETILIRQNVGRVVRAFSHREPFYWYLLWAPVCFFPWTLLLPPAAVAGIRRWRRGGGDAAMFAALWLVVPLVMLSLFSGKRVNYIVPLAPAAGILVGWYLCPGDEARAASARTVRWLLWVSFALLGAVICAGAAALVVARAVPGALHRALGGPNLYVEAVSEWLTPTRLVAAAVLLALALALVGTGIAAGVRRPARAGALLAAAVAVAFLVPDLMVAPPLNGLKSGRSIAVAASRLAVARARLYLFQDDFHGVYNLYTGVAPMPVVRGARALRSVLGRPGALVIADGGDAAEALARSELTRHTVFSAYVDGRTMLLLRGGR